MSDLSLFTPEQEPARYCSLGRRMYRARVTTRVGKLYILVEYNTSSSERVGPDDEWREVRFLNRRVDVVRALGMGEWDGRRIVLTDGRKEGEPHG